MVGDGKQNFIAHEIQIPSREFLGPALGKNYNLPPWQRWVDVPPGTGQLSLRFAIAISSVIMKFNETCKNNENKITPRTTKSNLTTLRRFRRRTVSIIPQSQQLGDATRKRWEGPSAQDWLRRHQTPLTPSPLNNIISCESVDNWQWGVLNINFIHLIISFSTPS